MSDMERVLAQVEELSRKVDEMTRTLTGVLAVFESIKGEIMPFLTKLESHPMLKMFLGGKTK